MLIELGLALVSYQDYITLLPVCRARGSTVGTDLSQKGRVLYFDPFIRAGLSRSVSPPQICWHAAAVLLHVGERGTRALFRTRMHHLLS